MPIDYIQKIIELARPMDPVERPMPRDWERLERDLRLTLPTDYKALVTALGSGQFGSGFVLHNPVSTSCYTCISRQNLECYRQNVLFLEERMDIALFPKPLGLVLIGGIDRQQFFFQPDTDPRTLSRLIHLDHDWETTRELDMPLAQFIHDLYRGLIPDEWANALKARIWGETAPFFESSPGRSSQ